MVAGFLAALLAYERLAGTLTVLTIWGLFAATLFLAAVRIVEALFEAVLEAGYLDRSNMVRRYKAKLLRVTSSILRLAVAGTWVFLVLRAATLWTPIRDLGIAVLTFEVGYGTIKISLGGAIAFGVTLYLSWLLARLIAFFMEAEVFPRVRLPQGVPFAIKSFMRYAVLVVGFIIAMSMLGFSLDRLTLLLSAVGVGIGFGLQNVINNFVSGVILLFERPVRVGDRVELSAGNVGVINRIGIRASVLRTFDGSDIIVPNGDLISNQVTNWTFADQRRRISLPVGVAYGTDPKRVQEILMDVAKRNTDVLTDPEPEALFDGFGDNSLDFLLRCWTINDWRRVKSDLAVDVYDKLNAAEIEIPFPQRDLHVRTVDPEAAVAFVRPRETAPRPESQE